MILEEERERELEELYEKGIADSMNRSDAPLNNGEDGVAADGGAEAGSVNKQTTETLMAGERIMEALDIADADRQAQHEYDEMVAKLPPTEAATVPPPTRDGVLTAYDIDGAAYVLMVVQKIHSTALQDALLVLPFSKVVSLMRYLDEWAIRVCIRACATTIMQPFCNKLLFSAVGAQHNLDLQNHVFPTQDPPSSDCCEPSYANRSRRPADPSARYAEEAEGGNWVQPRGSAIYSPTARVSAHIALSGAREYGRREGPGKVG